MLIAAVRFFVLNLAEKILLKLSILLFIIFIEILHHFFRFLSDTNFKAISENSEKDYVYNDLYK